jgi:glycosyltransferase involved in cell wall biosynthesis
MKKTMQPIVSICVITYNHEKYITDCLNSIIKQQIDFPIEILVSDDASTDKTPAIIKDFADRHPTIKPIFRTKNTGGVKNYIEVHNLAQGKYVCHLDGDDIFLPRKLQTQKDIMEQGNFSISWHKVNFFNDNHDFYDGNAMDYTFLHDQRVKLSDALTLGSIGVHSSVMYKRSARKTFSAPFPTLDLFYSWEYLESGDGVVIPIVLGGYRLNASGSISTNQAFETAKLTAKHYQFFLRKHPQFKQQIFTLSLISLIISLKNKRYSSAFIFLENAFKTWSFINPAAFINHLLNRRKITFPPRITPKKYDIMKLFD